MTPTIETNPLRNVTVDYVRFTFRKGYWEVFVLWEDLDRPGWREYRNNAAEHPIAVEPGFWEARLSGLDFTPGADPKPVSWTLTPP